MADAPGAPVPTSAGGRVFAWVSGLRPWQHWAVAAGAGVAATLALPPLYVVPALLLAFPALLLLVRTARSGRAAFGAGWWFGFGHFLTGLYWIGIAFLVNEDVSDWGGPLAVLAIAAFMAVFPALAAFALYRLRVWMAVRGKALALLGDALWLTFFWCAAEWLRGHVLTGFPWNLIGTVWAFSPSMMQSAALWGTYGLSLVTVLLATVPVTLLEPQPGPRRWLPPLAAVLALGLLWGGGAFRLGAAAEGVVPGVRLRLVQANVNQQDKWRRTKQTDNFVRHLELSAKPGRKPVTHVIWPETAVPYFLNAEPSRRFLIGAVAPRGGYVITGAPSLERTPAGAPIIGNSLFVIDDQGVIRGEYDKTHLVPFGEYVPLRKVLAFFGVERFVPSALDFTPGPGLETLHAPGLPAFSPLICYEIIFPGAVVRADDRPAWILNLTNDAWYGHSTGPYQHLVAAQMRAVEEGLPVVRAAGTGISAIIDPYGRIEAAFALGATGFIDGDLPQKIERETIFARIGDWSYLGLLAILLGLATRRVCRDEETKLRV